MWTRAPNDVWVGGASAVDGGSTEAVTMHFDGNQWTSATLPNGSEVRALWGTSSGDRWAATSFGALFHYEGTAWVLVPDAVPDNTGSSATWGTGPKDLWLGTLHFDGTTWTRAPRDGFVAVMSMYGRSTKDIWAVDAMGEVLHYEGDSWKLTSTVTGTAITGAGDDLWIVGHHGSILHKHL